MTKVVYFKDDHNRTVRVVAHVRGGISLHVLIARGGKSAWVPYDSTTPPTRDPGVEDLFGVPELRAQNITCPSFNRIQQKGRFHD
jgi:hypothetical protein